MAGVAPDVSLMARFALGAIIMRAAGCAFNDVVDRDIDAKVARTAARPVASGQISARAALVFVIVLCLAGLAILVTMNVAAGLLGVASLGLVAAYPFMKRITWWPQAWLGLTFNWGALMGYAAAAGGVSIVAGGWRSIALATGAEALPAVAAPIFLYVSGIFWTLGYDTIYALQDIEDDALAGVKSSARRLGRRAPFGVGVFYSLCVVFSGAVGWAAGLSILYFFILGVFALHLAVQVVGLKVVYAAFDQTGTPGSF